MQDKATEAEGCLRLSECNNCGATGHLLRCSRCKNAWYCNKACAKAYWPVHKSVCKVNDFAASIEATEPKFAAWMRQHGKQAIIKDDEIERLERAGRAVCALPSRHEVMENLYGRADPRPAGPTFTAEERLAMQRVKQQESNQARHITPQERVWQALPPIQPGLGLECRPGYRWTQDLSHVLVHIKLPPHVPSRQVRLTLTPLHLKVVLGAVTWVDGRLYRDVELSGSTWFIETGVLHIQLLKAARRGRYAQLTTALEAVTLDPLDMAPSTGDQQDEPRRTRAVRRATAPDQSLESTPAQAAVQAVPVTAADTFWRSLLRDMPADQQLQCIHPPTAYYFAGFDEEECWSSHV